MSLHFASWLRFLSYCLRWYLLFLNPKLAFADSSTTSVSMEHHVITEFHHLQPRNLSPTFARDDDGDNVNGAYINNYNPFLYECCCKNRLIDVCFFRASLTAMPARYFTTAYIERPKDTSALNNYADGFTIGPTTFDPPTIVAITDLSYEPARQPEVPREESRLPLIPKNCIPSTSQKSSLSGASLTRTRSTQITYLLATATTVFTTAYILDTEERVDSGLLAAAVATLSFILILAVLSTLIASVGSSAVHRSRSSIKPLPEVYMAQNHPLHTYVVETRYAEGTSRSGTAVRNVYNFEHSSNDSPPQKAALFMDNDRIVQFIPSAVTPGPRLGDRVKEVIEICLRYPVIWWPLEPRRICCPNDYTRVSWYCGCGAQLYVDLPIDEAEEYRRQCIPVTLPFGGSTLLPEYNPASTHASSGSSTQAQRNDAAYYNLNQRFSRRNLELSGSYPRIRDAQQAEIISDLARGRYLHWCVDINRFETQLFHIPILSMTDMKIISKLKSAYNAASGFRRWFSLTACYGVKFIMFERIHRSKELIACSKEDLPCPKTNKEYAYTYLDPREQFIKTLERTLMHHFHTTSGCGAQDIEDILKRLPKKVNGKLEMRFGAAGYGAYAVPGWAFWKLLTALVLTQIGPSIFAIRWLCGHPDDLQNAFILSFYSVALLNLVVVVPEIWSMHK